MSVGGICSAGANIGECGWDTAGSVVCAAFCGITAWIRVQILRYRSTVGETPDAHGVGGEGGALGVRLGQAGPAWVWQGRVEPGLYGRGRGPGARGGETGAGR